MDPAGKASALLDDYRIHGKAAVFSIPRRSSIREQLRRGVSLVRALVDSGELVPENDPRVLVVGGGITGAAVACKLASFGIEANLREQAPHLFPLQWQCETRWLHPYEYDWPLAHYETTSYPAFPEDRELCPEPLEWKTNPAKRIASVWQKAMSRHMSASRGNLVIQTATEVNLNELIDAESEYSHVILCVGGRERGIENCTFTGYHYWETDPFEDPSMGFPHLVPSLRILISGGGDGALQELQRAAFQVPQKEPILASAILKRLEPQLVRCPSFLAYKAKNHLDECRPEPAHLWQTHQALLADWRQLGLWPDIAAAIESLLHPEIIASQRQITLAVGNRDHLDEAFALNSLLFHLFWAAISESRWKDQFTFLRRTRLHSVEAKLPDHACGRPGETCRPYVHHVRLDTYSGAQVTASKQEDYEVVIVRHGSRDTKYRLPS